MSIEITITTGATPDLMRSGRLTAYLDEREQAIDHDYAVGDLTADRRKQIAREVRAKHRARWVSDCAGEVIAATPGVPGVTPMLDDGGPIWVGDPNEIMNLKGRVETASVAYPGGEADAFREDVLGVVVGEIESAVGGIA